MTRRLGDAMLPSFLGCFGSDNQCHVHVFETRWPEGLRCSACGHDRVRVHKTCLIYECAVKSRPPPAGPSSQRQPETHG